MKIYSEIKRNYKNNQHLYSHHIRSFVLRNNRLSKRQKYAIDNYWSIIGVEFSNQPIDLIVLFGRDAPVVLEIGLGMGTSLLTMAQRHPEKNFLGIEVYLPGVGSCLASAYEKGIENLRVICHDAVEVLYKMIPNNSLNLVQLFFPDPWHKKRHHKRRIVQTEFSEIVKNKLKIGGIFHMATDWEPYAEHMLKTISSLDGYKNQSKSNNYITRPLSRPITKFEQRGQHLGHNIWDLMFKKIK